MYNRVFLAGYVGNVNNNESFSTFSLATESYIKKNDKFEKKTSWHSCIIGSYNKKNFDNMVKKGSFLIVEGELVYNKKDDIKYTNISVQKFRIVNPKPVEKEKEDEDLPF